MATRIYPMGLIVTALIVLMLPGVIYNNFANSGFNPAYALSCPNTSLGGWTDVTCTNSNNTGCQSVAAQCALNTATISFLNQNSPFTTLISGNIGGLFQGLTSNGNANRGPFDPAGGGGYYTADCTINTVAAGAGQNITTNSFAARIGTCSQTNPDRSNMTKASAFTWGDWNFNLLGVSQVNTPFYRVLTNATYALTCYNQGYWFVTAQAQVGYSIIGCDFYKAAGYSPPANPNVNPVYSFLVAVPCSAPGTGGCKAQTFTTAYTHLEVFVQPEQWDTQFCTNAFTVATQNQQIWYGSQQCYNLETWFTTPHAGGLQAGFFTPFLTILIGLILFLIGLGINVQAGGSIFGTGTQFGAGVNPQGTRLAQVLGIALIAYTPLYSEFSTWFTSGVLPNGLDGNVASISSGTGIIAFVISAIFFGGIIWQVVAWE